MTKISLVTRIPLMRFLILSGKRRGGLTFGGVGIAKELLNNFPLRKMRSSSNFQFLSIQGSVTTQLVAAIKSPETTSFCRVFTTQLVAVIKTLERTPFCKVLFLIKQKV